MEKLNNKETINLLDLSDDESDISDLFITPKKKKVKRRHRSNGLSKTRQVGSHGCKLSRMRVASLWLAAILITIWFATLSWLAVVLYGELKRMDVSVKSVDFCSSYTVLFMKIVENIWKIFVIMHLVSFVSLSYETLLIILLITTIEEIIQRIHYKYQRNKK